MQSHPSWQSKLGPCVVPWGARFDNYLLLLHDQSIYMSRPSFFAEAYILDALKIQEKNFDMMRIGCRVIILMDYYSLFNNGMLFPWIVWFIGDSLLKIFLKRRCLNIWWVFLHIVWIHSTCFKLEWFTRHTRTEVAALRTRFMKCYAICIRWTIKGQWSWWY